MRVAHISDFHLRHHLTGTSAVTARRSRLMPELLVEAVESISAAEPDFVAVTGDLIDHPHEPVDTDDSLRDGEADLRLVADVLASLACPWSVLPGNHDHPGLFVAAFGVLPGELAVCDHRFVAFHDWEGDQNVPERIGAQRFRFDAVLADDGDHRPQVHLQHYLVAPERNEGYPHTYGDGQDLRRSLVDDGRVRLVLSGHYHRGVEPWREGDAWFATAPAFCEAPHPYLIHDLDADSGDLTSTRVELR